MTSHNDEQRRYWNENAGPTWVERRGDLDRLLEPLTHRLLERAALREGERVLDVGCGAGYTTVEIARRVGPEGRATGLDISSVMLEGARRRAREASVAIELLESDAQKHTFAADAFDVLVSRFGVMFFADPTAAFANLHTALAEHARLHFLCWQPVAANPWVRLPLQAIAAEVELPAPPEPGSPGPFAFGDDERVRAVLDDAGFVELEVTPLTQQMSLGRDVEEALDFLLEVGPASRALAEATEEEKQAAMGSLRHALREHEGEAGVELEAAAWLVSARTN